MNLNRDLEIQWRWWLVPSALPLGIWFMESLMTAWGVYYRVHIEARHAEAKRGPKTAIPTPHNLTHTMNTFNLFAVCRRSRNHCVFLWELKECLGGFLVRRERDLGEQGQRAHRSWVTNHPNLSRLKGFSRHRVLSAKRGTVLDKLGKLAPYTDPQTWA